MISRSQRITSTVLCSRHARGDGASISVWCSPVGWHQCTEIKSEHETDGCLRQALESGKKAKNRSEGEFVS
jgi:hypothetical protein